MNSSKNLKIVHNCGDSVQLEYGVEFGAYAKQINKELLNSFCSTLNLNPWMQENGYYFFTTKYTTSNSGIVLRHYGKNLFIHIRLLDHSIFMEATDTDWIKIDTQFFKTLQNEWRKFLSNHITEYRDHITKTIVLGQLDVINNI